MTIDEKFMYRCLQLAVSGLGSVAPNPLVGSVIVFNNQIIGEGYHKEYGQPHAEVVAINSVKSTEFIKHSTLYVNLEPCSHHGKTPPCADLIIAKKIPKVVIGSTDPNPLVCGNGITKLKNAGIEVVTGVLEKESNEVNKRFFTFLEKKRPYILLKWAQTKDGFMDFIRDENEIPHINWITSPELKILVHKWRSEEKAILVGSNTVKSDNPELTAREWIGENPIRIILDSTGEITTNYKILNTSAPTLIFNPKKNEIIENVKFINIEFNQLLLNTIFEYLYNLNIQSVIVEGGKMLLETFISAGIWDEARILIGDKIFGEGLIAPEIKGKEAQKIDFENERIFIYRNHQLI